MTISTDTAAASVPELWDELTRRVAAGSRLADLFGTAQPDGLLLTAHLAGPAGLETWQARLPSGTVSYPALTRGWARRSGMSGRSTTCSASSRTVIPASSR
jgi:hypothetical protein